MLSNIVTTLSAMQEYDADWLQSEVYFIEELHKHEKKYIKTAIDRLKEKLTELGYDAKKGGFPEEQKGVPLENYNDLASDDCLFMILQSRQEARIKLEEEKMEEELKKLEEEDEDDDEFREVAKKFGKKFMDDMLKDLENGII